MSLAGYLPPLLVQVVASTTGFHAEMDKVQAKAVSLEGGFKRLAVIGKLAFAGLATAAAGVGYESVKLAMNFDQTMELLHTQAGVGQTDVEDLKRKVLDLAPAVGIGPEKLAEGLYHIASTGVPAAKQMDILTQAARLAKLGMADLDDVTFALSGVMSVGMKDVHNAADAIAFMNAAVGEGDMRMGQLAAAIGTGVLPSFKSAGLGMNDFTAMLATLADNSTPADEAATRLRMTVGLMSAPSHKAAEALNSIGLSSTQLAEDMRKPNGGLVAIMDLKKHLEQTFPAAKNMKMSVDEIKSQLGAYAASLKDAGYTTAQAAPMLDDFRKAMEQIGTGAVKQQQVMEHAFGGARTSSSILTLIEESGKLSDKYKQQGTSAERAAKLQEAWAEQQKQFKQQLDQLIAQLQVWGVKIGNWLIPKIEALVGWMSKHKDLVKALAIVIGVVLVAAIAAAVVGFVAANALIIGITLLVGGLIFIVGALATHWSAVWHAMGAALSWVYNHTIGPIINAISSAINSVSNAMGDLSSVKPGGRNVNDVRAGFGHIGHYASGGVVPGPIGMPQLAVVHGGETVIPNGGSGDLVLHATFVYPDGRHVRTEMLRYNRRSGLNGASDLYPASANSIIR